MTASSPEDVVPPLTRWQRWLYAAVFLLAGSGMIVWGVAQVATLLSALRALPPTITVYTGVTGLVLMGVAIVGFGTLALGTPVAERRARRRGSGRGLDRAQIVTALGLACLVAFPVLTVCLRLGTAGYLTARGYHRETDDPGFHSRFLSIRWVRNGDALGHGPGGVRG